jgi:RNA polymerase sigma-70 factor (ECF subfamily)
MESSETSESGIAASAASLPKDRHRFRALMQRAQEGSTEAAKELEATYGEYIIRAVRRRLSRLLRPRFDSIDFVQDVWASFYRGSDRDFESPEHLIAFLTRVAQNKVIDAARGGIEAQKRDVTREERIVEPAAGKMPQAVFARDGTPSQTAISHEMWEQMLRNQLPVYRQVLVRLRDGSTQLEVAAELNLPRKTVQRILERAMEKIQRAMEKIRP